MFDKETELYEELWAATEKEREKHELKPEDRETMGRLQAEELRATSRECRAGSATSACGFHLRHFGFLGDEGLEALADIIEIVELLGVIPRQLWRIIIVFLENASGGKRCIGIFPGLYRYWGKLRRSTAQSFEDTFASNSFFAGGSGKGAGDAIWRQAVRTEAAKGEGAHIAVILKDFLKFYELVPLSKLLVKANASGLNKVLVRVVLGPYKMQRFFSEGLFFRKGYFAMNGIVAGCSFATTMVKVFFQSEFLELEARHPHIRFQVYIDDLSAQTTSQSEKKVLREMWAFAADLRSMAEGELQAKIADKKSAIDSSSRKLAEQLAERIGLEKAVVKDVALNLGADCSGGKNAQKKESVEENVKYQGGHGKIQERSAAMEGRHREERFQSCIL